MAREVWQRAEIDSPCIRICMIDRGTQICLGCGRSVDEIARWACMSLEERREVLAALPARRRDR